MWSEAEEDPGATGEKDLEEAGPFHAILSGFGWLSLGLASKPFAHPMVFRQNNHHCDLLGSSFQM